MLRHALRFSRVLPRSITVLPVVTLRRGLQTKCDIEHPIYNPTAEHLSLRHSVRKFAETKVAEQAAKYDKLGEMNKELFRECGELGILGVTIPEKDGGAGMDATAATIIHHELSKYDPGKVAPESFR